MLYLYFYILKKKKKASSFFRPCLIVGDEIFRIRLDLSNRKESENEFQGILLLRVEAASEPRPHCKWILRKWHPNHAGTRIFLAGCGPNNSGPYSSGLWVKHEAVHVFNFLIFIMFFWHRDFQKSMSRAAKDKYFSPEKPLIFFTLLVGDRWRSKLVVCMVVRITVFSFDQRIIASSREEDNGNLGTNRAFREVKKSFNLCFSPVSEFSKHKMNSVFFFFPWAISLTREYHLWFWILIGESSFKGIIWSWVFVQIIDF